MLIARKRDDAKKYCVQAEKAGGERTEGMKCGGGGGRCTLLDLGDDLEASVVLHSSVIYANLPLIFCTLMYSNELTTREFFQTSL